MAEKEREENFAKVIDFPKEVRVYGQISQVYFEGKDKFTTLIVERSKASSSGAQPKKEKSKKEPILIVPIKQKNSELRFIKVPLQKLSKIPKAEKLSEGFCPKVDLYDGTPRMERIAEYKTNMKEIWRKDSFNNNRNDFDTCFVFQQRDPFQKDFFPNSNFPIADLFHFKEKSKLEKGKEETIEEIKEEKAKVESNKVEMREFQSTTEAPQPYLTKKPSVREAETNTDVNERLMKFLVSPNKRSRMSK